MATQNNNQQIQDPRESGVSGLKGLNRQKEVVKIPFATSASAFRANQRALNASAAPVEEIGNLFPEAGTSIYDKNANSIDDLIHLGNVRAENQSALAKWGAGIAKAVGLAGTTFLDGTLGLINGIGEMPHRGVAALWDNDISNQLADINKKMEEWLPNYRTEQELENEWYENLGTANFWADSFIKNLGFTVGAFYSGGAWLKALKGLKLVKGGLAAQSLGAVLSGVNEARIEANNTVREILPITIQKINETADLSREEILNDEFGDKEARIQEIESNRQKLLDQAQVNADSIGLMTFLGNTAFLSLGNFAQFGKLYARGFKNARNLSKGITAGVEEQLTKEVGKNIARQGSTYAWKDITKAGAFLKGARNGLIEGNEELAQALIASTATHKYTPDSPDAYYKALHTGEEESKDMLTSLIQGMKDSYGDIDRWEEFAVGALTGLLGMPTFGQVNNSDANTYLGRGRSIGLSGGLFGEISSANQRNREGRATVDVMNRFVNSMQDKKRQFVRSTAFTDAMNGWAAANDAFEYKNAEDNEMFSAISAFSRAGKLSDLKEIVNQDFENISDDELASIALHTSPNVELHDDGTVESSDIDGKSAVGGWRNEDGTLMSDTEEGRAQMRKDLIKKRDKILAEIDKYQSSVENVRAIGNNSLTEDQVNELAWLNWKVGVFTDRYNSIKEENREFLNSLQKTIKAFENGRGRGMIDEGSEEGQNLVKAIENTGLFIDALLNAETPLQLASIMENNPHITAFIEEIGFPTLEDMSGIDSATFTASMKNLKDTIKIAKAAKSFNQRYKDFVDNPIDLIKNRQKIDKEQEKVTQATQELSAKDKINNSSVTELVQKAENGDVNLDTLDGLFTEEDDDFIQTVKGKTEPSGKQKVQEAKEIINTSQRMDGILEQMGADAQALQDAHTLLQQSKSVSNSQQELLDTTSQAFNDPNLLFDIEDPSMQNLTTEDLQSLLNDRLDEAKSLIEQAKARLKEQDVQLDKVPTGELINDGQISVEEAKDTTGHDQSSTTQTANETKKKKEEKSQAQKAVSEEQDWIDNLFADVTSVLPSDTRDLFNQKLADVLDSINTMVKNGTPVVISNTQSMQTLKQIVPDIDNYLAAYVKHLLDSRTQKQNPTEKQDTTSTPTITEEEIQAQTNAQHNSNPNQSELTGTYQFWNPTTSRIGQHNPIGDNTPYYEVAQYITTAFEKKENGKEFSAKEKLYWDAYVVPGYVKSPYSDQQIRRMRAVYNYLQENGAFTSIENGVVQGEVNKKAFKKDAEGDPIYFTIDRALNEKAGEIVILMTDSQGRILGDVMSPNDAPFSRRIGLPQFVERVIKEYTDADSPEHFTSKETTVVDKNMVGKVPYLPNHEVMHTLNTIYNDGSNDIEFKLGIAINSGSNARILATAGRTKNEGQSDLEKSINPALEAKSGQPFLLMETSDKSGRKQYMPVPILMPKYGEGTRNTALGKAIEEVLERVPTSDNSTAVEIINDLQELLAIPEIHINYNGENVHITIRPNGAEHQRTIYNGAKNADGIVEQLAQGLQGMPFQVSRKYINTTYKEYSYNRMIGEVAQANLPIGATHTINDWFTVKPIGADGKIMGAKSPRSTGQNPHAATPQNITFTLGNLQLAVSKDYKTITDLTSGNVFTADTAPNNKARAYAYGLVNNKNMEQPYDTEWGYYDPATNQFIEKPTNQAGPLAQIVMSNFQGYFEGGGAVIEEYYPNLPAELINKLENSLWSNNAPVLTEEEAREFLEKSRPNLLPTSVETPTQLENKAKMAGLLGSKIRQALWSMLTQEQQSIIANKKGQKQRQWMEVLTSAFNPATNTFDTNMIGGSIDDLLGNKIHYREAQDATYTLWDKDKEITWLKSALPNLSNEDHLRITDGLIRIVDSRDSGLAYGMFKNGLMTISDTAARGTLYHEAFHAVVHTLLTNEEYQSLFEAASERWGDVDNVQLEENLAEEFRHFMQSEEDWYDSISNYGTVRKALAILFHKLKNLVRELSSNTSYIDKLFYSINRGKFSRRNIQQSNATRTMEESYTPEMQDIKAKAIADNTFMKAPNGNPTNLTERQWLQVRTKAFKDWFGDWEAQYNTIEILNNDGSINFEKLEELTDEYFKNADESLFTKGRKTLRERKEHHVGENNTLEHLQNVVKSAQKSNISENLKPHVIVAAALHDIAKPFHKGNSHGFQSEALLDKIFKGKVSSLAKFAIAHHMMTIEEGIAFTREDAERIVNDARNRGLDVNEAIDVLIALHVADITRGRNLEDIDEYSNKSIREIINTEVENELNLLKEASSKIVSNNSVSKVVDENGEPLVVYHGTYTDITEFNYKDGREYNPGFFFTSDKKYAFNIAALKGGELLIPTFLNIKEPVITNTPIVSHDVEGIFIIQGNKNTDGIIGHDKVTDELPQSEGTEYVVLRSNQIKSATDNIGTFDSSNPDIRFRMADGFRGTISEFQGIVDSVVNNANNSRVSKNKAWGKLVDSFRSEGYIVKGYSKHGNWVVASVVDIRPKTYYRRVEQHHRDKMMYGNLLQEQRDYIEERGISIDEYNSMTTFEKEVLFQCQY